MSGQVSLGSPCVDDGLDVAQTVRIRPGRSCLTSAISWSMPSNRNCCQPLPRSTSRRVRSDRRRSAPTTSSDASGFASTCCSAATSRRSCSWAKPRSRVAARDRPAWRRPPATRGAQPVEQRREARLLVQRGARQARSRRNDDTGITGRSMPAFARCRRSSSTIRRHAGYRSVLVTTQTAAGQRSSAWRRKATSGPGQLLRGVGHEDHAEGGAQRAEGDDPVRRLQPADAGGVDEAQPGLAAGGGGAGPRPSAGAAASSRRRPRRRGRRAGRRRRAPRRRRPRGPSASPVVGRLEVRHGRGLGRRTGRRWARR